MPRVDVRGSLRESLTGPRSISLSGWLATLIPASVLVIVQETATPFPSFGFVAVSAAMQHAADGLLALIALTVQRTFPHLDRLLLRVLLWTFIGISRGLIGGAWAAAFAGVSPDYGYRIAFWLLVTWTWMPAIGYALAQLELRRELLGVRDAERTDLERERAADVENRGTLRASLLETVHQSVGPAVEEIRERLLRMGETLDPVTTGKIGRRISDVVDEAARIVRGVPPTASGPVPTSGPRASLWAAIAFDQRRPLWGAAVMTLGMAILLIPDTLRVSGMAGALSVAIGILASVSVVLIAALLERAVRPRSGTAQVAAFVIRVLAAGLAGTATILLIGDRSDDEVLLAAGILPLVAALGATIVPTIVGIRRANLAVVAEIDDLRAERDRVRTSSRAEEARVRAQLTELLHGPIQGRLSACAMALSFHAAADPPPDSERTAFIATAVLDHLDAVTRDLEALADPPNPAPHPADLAGADPVEGGGARRPHD